MIGLTLYLGVAFTAMGFSDEKNTGIIWIVAGAILLAVYHKVTHA